MWFQKQRRRLPAILTGMATACLTTVAAAQSERQEQPIPLNLKQSLTAIERSFAVVPEPAPLTMFPQMREQLKDAPAFLRDSKAAFNFRSYYRDNVTNNTPGGSGWNEAWAAGGSASFETGRLFNLISGGMVLYTSFPVYAPLDHDGTGLLKPGQQQYGVLGQLYGKVHITDNHEIVAGRYLYDTPFIGPHDNRMSPKTFYGYVLHGTFGDIETGPHLRYGGGYIAAMKERNATDFVSMSQSAGAADPRGTGVLGGMFSWGPFRIGAIEYYTQDTINIAYAESKYGANLAPDWNAALALQFADQRSTGTELLNGGNPFGTNQFGAQLQLDYKTAILTAAYTVVNPGFSMQTPWSANPFYTDGQIQAFNRAGENTLMVGLSYGLAPIGVPGVAASIFYFNGWTSAAAAGGPLTEYEWDFNLEWRPEWKPLPGLWFRARYGYSSTDQNNVHTTVDEVRLILNYTVKLY
jgi:outer membrane porin, OprD family